MVGGATDSGVLQSRGGEVSSGFTEINQLYRLFSGKKDASSNKTEPIEEFHVSTMVSKVPESD